MNNKEADTKLVSLVRHAKEPNTEHENTKYFVRSCLMDIDIPIQFLFLPVNVDVIIDNGRSNARKMLSFNQCTLNENQKNAVVGLHYSAKERKGAGRLPRNISMFVVNLVYPIIF